MKRRRHPATVPGMRYGRLVAFEFVGRNRWRHLLWQFQCDCGSRPTIVLADVRRGTTRSCGCYQREHALMRRDREFASAMGKLGGKSRSPRKLAACRATLAQFCCSKIREDSNG